MHRSAPLAFIAGALAVLAALAGCDGQVIRLGNCPHTGVPASQVAWIGDSWVLVPNGEEHTIVRDQARTSGAIGPSDDYTIDAAAATTMSQIVTQYTTQQMSGTTVKVLIMDGGTWDTIVNGSSSTTVAEVANTFAGLLSMVASDGTATDVIYYLTPELSGIPGVAQLRSLLERACAGSAVRCHFLDLQQLWNGHPEYTATGTIPVPTAAGATVIADAIWGIMQSSCIAQ